MNAAFPLRPWQIGIPEDGAFATYPIRPVGDRWLFLADISANFSPAVRIFGFIVLFQILG
ncbi:hypothetical protein [Sphingomonas alpina]|uniref:Uncharacterized protein n=1 Tax=Sphingomonas alpina TaxID=653931 RepID=A0A7H0LK82_9SPHN|nr:hypothetical protein [Sphingomonas alpina]QNQ10085.1 hypothetical protein H3Z74_02200 [Sphingomonas alpina]